MKSYLLISLFVLYAAKTSATTYTFTGDGNWSSSGNWQNGLVPPMSIPGGSSIIISGNAVSDFRNSGLQLYRIPTNVSLTILTGASFSISLDKEFVLDGIMNVQGTFNDNNLVFLGNGTITVSGIYNTGYVTDLDTLTISSGGAVHNRSRLSVRHFTIQTGGNFINSGILYGTTAITGNFQNTATLAPGNSPGTIELTGDYTASSSATHNFEVAGTSPNQYDRLLVSGALNVNGTLNISLISGFTPTTSHDLTIMTGTVNGTFATVNIPASYSLIYNSNSIVLQYLQSLPVTFLNFDAKKEGAAVKLNWNISDELNVTNYEIEKSEDGRRFVKIGSIKASGQNSYSFSDQLYSNRAFYRIKGVDVNGEYKYSGIVRLARGTSSIVLSVFPTPARDQLIIQHSTADKTSRINLYSVEGKLLMAIVPVSSSQQTRVDINDLKPGIYILHYQDEKTREIVKVIKQ